MRRWQKPRISNPFRFPIKASLLVAVLLCFSFPLFAQVVEVRGAEGRWAIANITPERAKGKALAEAKREALRLAGVSERVRATDALSSMSDGSDTWQVFNSFSSIEVGGAVVDYDIVENNIIKENEAIYSVVRINAKVKIYKTDIDDEFKLSVSALRRSGYKHGEPIEFSVLPNKSGYLKIFLFEDTENANLVYPNLYEADKLFVEKTPVFFPTNKMIQYTAQKMKRGKIEHNYLIFVYTKKDIPFAAKVTYKSVLNWINDIEPSERDVVFESVLITE